MLLFFDTETTGLPKNWKAPVTDLNNWPRMVQLAYLLFDSNGNRISDGNYIVKPNGFTIPNDAFQVHGISNERASREGVSLESVLRDFQILIEQATFIVAHNIDFDEKVVGAEFLRCNMPNSLNSKGKICTMKSSIDFCAIDGPYGYKWPKLSELHHKLFNTHFEEAHNAELDIAATAKCFWELTSRGVIVFQSENHETPKEKDVKNRDTPMTDLARPILDKYCSEHGFNEIPIAAKADAIMHLNLKFRQLELNMNIEDEFIFLEDYHKRTDFMLWNPAASEVQQEFILLTQKTIIEEHKSFPLFNDGEHETIEEKISMLEALSVIKANETKRYRDLVIQLYYYYLSAYEDFLPEEKQRCNNKPDYSGVSEVAKTSHELFNKLMSDFEVQFYETRNGDVPELIFNLVNSCNKQLKIMDSELGQEHKLYYDTAQLLVSSSEYLLSEWVKTHSNLLSVSAQDMKLGKTFLDVCNTVFEAIDKVEVNANAKNLFNIRKASFDNLKQSLQPKSGCYIATMTYGSYNHPQVILLREFRDQYLQTTSLGRLFIQFYYATSIRLVYFCKDNKLFIKMTRICLDALVNKFLKKDTKCDERIIEKGDIPPLPSKTATALSKRFS
jgi:DNA polymerase-3 subunit epsilon